MGEIFMIILGTLSVFAALFLILKPYLPPVIFAYLALWFFYWGKMAWFSHQDFLILGIITIISTIMDLFQEDKQNHKFLASLYMLVGAICGALIGSVLNFVLLIVLCSIGVALGMFVYAKTPLSGKTQFSYSALFQYFCAQGLRIIIVVSMIGLVFGSYIATNASGELLYIY
ncbi:MAG: DUF456 family protein [Muribaculaceae bacterium]|nr:DUF456 family protein [Muribaculaceae bacterium]